MYQSTAIGYLPTAHDDFSLLHHLGTGLVAIVVAHCQAGIELYTQEARSK